MLDLSRYPRPLSYLRLGLSSQAPRQDRLSSVSPLRDSGHSAAQFVETLFALYLLINVCTRVLRRLPMQSARRGMGFPYQREGPLSQGGVENGIGPSIGSPGQEWCFRLISRNWVGLWSRRTWTPAIPSFQIIRSQSNDQDSGLYGLGTPVDVELRFGSHRKCVRTFMTCSRRHLTGCATPQLFVWTRG